MMAGSLVPATAALGGEVRAEPKAVLELFTSQGCSSCPPADALFAELARRSDLVTLAYHVDYWDYIGWPDTFGAEANSDLQRDYAASWGSARIYTPQLVINGAKGVVASRRDEVDSAVKAASLSLDVGLVDSDGALDITIAGHPGLAKSAKVWLVTYRDRVDVPIEGGENDGKNITYTQIVTGRQVVAMWDESTGAQFKLPLTDVIGETGTGAAIIVQTDMDGLPGRIIGAASITH